MKTTNKLLIAGTIVALGTAFYFKFKKDKSTTTTNEDKPNNTGTTVDNVSNPDVEDVKEPSETPVKGDLSPTIPSQEEDPLQGTGGIKPSNDVRQMTDEEQRRYWQEQARLRREREQAEAKRERQEAKRREQERLQRERERQARLKREREQRESSRNQISLPSGGYDIDIPIFKRPRYDTGNRDGSISSGRGGTSRSQNMPEEIYMPERPRRVRDTGVLNRGNTRMMRFTGDASDVDLLNLRVH